MVTTKARRPVSRFAQEHFGKGQSTLLRRMLTRQFGDLPSELIHRLEAASLDELERISDRLLGAQTLEQVFTEED